MTTTKTTIPNALRMHRKAAGLRQMDVARILGLHSADRISRWEKGRTFPHIVNLFKMAALYHVAPHDLYGEYFTMIGEEVTRQRAVASPAAFSGADMPSSVMTYPSEMRRS